jgi:hypothetical protein
LAYVFFDNEDGNMLFRNVGWISADYRIMYPKRYKS